jgi:DNA gyrase subunit B
MTAALGALEPNGYELSVLSSTDAGDVLRIVEKETGAAASVVVPSELLASPIYANVSKTYARLAELVGQPPYTIAYGKKTRRAETFGQLREQVLELAKEGIQVSRFKGLGEMDAEELAETTMNPANRMLIRVDVEDAAAADRVFSMLMGDQVEPRRAFIEQNAREVRFLDV